MCVLFFTVTPPNTFLDLLFFVSSLLEDPERPQQRKNLSLDIGFGRRTLLHITTIFFLLGECQHYHSCQQCLWFWLECVELFALIRCQLGWLVVGCEAWMCAIFRLWVIWVWKCFEAICKKCRVAISKVLSAKFFFRTWVQHSRVMCDSFPLQSGARRIKQLHATTPKLRCNANGLNHPFTPSSVLTCLWDFILFTCYQGFRKILRQVFSVHVAGPEEYLLYCVKRFSTA